jgi:hypothetical protein
MLLPGSVAMLGSLAGHAAKRAERDPKMLWETLMLEGRPCRDKLIRHSRGGDCRPEFDQKRDTAFPDGAALLAGRWHRIKARFPRP